ncbi:hypothetical protein P689_119219 [Candidatus Riesia pediculischaeffi PTSU]|uniref:Uncharacterized protein n=1 Tax=Candidatus Riesia pediculischaeffi PTSU TaxID=1401651 RepID=A0A0C1V8T5_9ENTR|nr:hypothetical protein P689_119219 [Candidatus Riesia pediculischaeffi PTSU]
MNLIFKKLLRQIVFDNPIMLKRNNFVIRSKRKIKKIKKRWRKSIFLNFIKQIS